MCWKNETSGTWQWSPETIAFIKGSTVADLEVASGRSTLPTTCDGDATEPDRPTRRAK